MCCGRAGKETDKRNLTLVDDTCTEITLTLWGSTAKADERRWEGNPVVAFKGVKVMYLMCACVYACMLGNLAR